MPIAEACECITASVERYRLKYGAADTLDMPYFNGECQPSGVVALIGSLIPFEYMLP